MNFIFILFYFFMQCTINKGERRELTEANEARSDRSGIGGSSG